jgi:chaperone BCS1
MDEFDGIKIKWMLIEKTDNRPLKNHDDLELYGVQGIPGRGMYNNNPKGNGKNGFVLSFDEKHRDKVMEKYLPHVLRAYEAIEAERRSLKIHSSQSGCGWRHSKFNHPASFDSLALDPDLRKTITDDLDRFLRRKNIYKKVGKPWKRGYLLYGPPGTGKSSLIVAIAKYLKFDVYDLDLSSVLSNTNLTTMLRNTSNRSVIVIEDIDCNKEVLHRSESADMYPDMGVKVCCFQICIYLCQIILAYYDILGCIAMDLDSVQSKRGDCSAVGQIRRPYVTAHDPIPYCT